MPTADFPDVNVWVALTVEDHVHHLRAETYWRTEADSSLAFCRITALGLVRVTSQRHTFGGRPLTPNEAWSNYVRWRGQSEVTILTEPLGIDDIMGNWIDRGLATTKNWTDLYLAAFATAGRLRLVTFDSDFAAFPGLDLLQLKG